MPQRCIIEACSYLLLTTQAYIDAVWRVARPQKLTLRFRVVRYRQT